MQMYLPFGDWSDDGHGKYTKVLIDAPSMEKLYEVQKTIKIIWGNSFFSTMCQDYQDNVLKDVHWEALIQTNYPVERLIKYETINDWSDIKDVAEAYHTDPKALVSIDFVIDIFIYLLNYYGACITKCEDQHPIPTICNWTCPGFETVGYGCFDI